MCPGSAWESLLCYRDIKALRDVLGCDGWTDRCLRLSQKAEVLHPCLSHLNSDQSFIIYWTLITEKYEPWMYDVTDTVQCNFKLGKLQLTKRYLSIMNLYRIGADYMSGWYSVFFFFKEILTAQWRPTCFTGSFHSWSAELKKCIKNGKSQL